MATPRSSAYTAASGAGIYAGIASPPFTIPAPGGTANISRNNYTAININPATWATSYPNTSPWRNWCGAAFASGFSANGAMIYWGGGHNGGSGTDAYVFDFTTAEWSRVGPGDPTTDYMRERDSESNPGLSLLDTTWADYPHAGGNIIPATHTYAYPCYIPPEFAGAGPKGQWLLTNVVLGPFWNAAGVRIDGGMKPHYIDLSTGFEDRWTTNIGTQAGHPGFAGTIVDTVRGKVFWGAAEAATINVVNLADSHPRAIATQAMSGNRFAEAQAYYPIYVYVPAADRFVELSCAYGTTVPMIAVYNTTTGNCVHAGFITLPTTGRPTLNPGFGADWVPSRSAFYIYDGAGSTTVHKLHCSDPANLGAATWTWSAETFSGPAWPSGYVDASGNSRPHSKWRYIPAIDCFAWCDVGFAAVCQDGLTHDNAMQLWRPN